MDTLTAQEAQEQFFKVLEMASKANHQYRITSHAGNVVILPEETYNNLLITLEVLSTPGLMNSLREANSSPDDGSEFNPLSMN